MSRTRLSIWIPEKDRWIFDLIEDIRLVGEAEGLEVTQATVILPLLLDRLQLYKDAPNKFFVDRFNESLLSQTGSVVEAPLGEDSRREEATRLGPESDSVEGVDPTSEARID